MLQEFFDNLVLVFVVFPLKMLQLSFVILEDPSLLLAIAPHKPLSTPTKHLALLKRKHLLVLIYGFVDIIIQSKIHAKKKVQATKHLEIANKKTTPKN